MPSDQRCADRKRCRPLLSARSGLPARDRGPVGWLPKLGEPHRAIHLLAQRGRDSLPGYSRWRRTRRCHTVSSECPPWHRRAKSACHRIGYGCRCAGSRLDRYSLRSVRSVGCSKPDCWSWWLPTAGHWHHRSANVPAMPGWGVISPPPSIL